MSLCFETNYLSSFFQSSFKRFLQMVGCVFDIEIFASASRDFRYIYRILMIF